MPLSHSKQHTGCGFQRSLVPGLGSPSFFTWPKEHLLLVTFSTSCGLNRTTLIYALCMANSAQLQLLVPLFCLAFNLMLWPWEKVLAKSIGAGKNP